MRSLIVYIAIVSGVANPAATAEPITLEQALRMASEANAGLLAARAGAMAQRERGEAARRARWPRLVLGSGFAHTDNPALVFSQKLNSGQFQDSDFAVTGLNDPTFFSHFTTTVTAEVPIDLFGRVDAQADAENWLADALAADAEATLSQLNSQVVVAYRESVVAREAVGVTQRALEGARAREAEIEARVAQGGALRASLLRARSRRRSREADLAERRADADLALLELGRLLGTDGAAFDVVDTPPAPQALPGDQASWTQRALRQRSSLEGSHHRVAAAESARRATERTLWPDLAGFARLQDDRNSLGNRQSWTLGVGLQWNILDLGRGRREAAAVAEERATQQAEVAAIDHVKLEVAQAWRRAVAARERHRAAAGGAEEGAEALRVVQARRRVGLATLTDELETEAASLLAELHELQTLAEVAIADARLLRAVGVTDPAAFAGGIEP